MVYQKKWFKVLQWISAMLMAFLFSIFFQKFLENRKQFNRSSSIFMTVLLCFTFFSFFWILSNPKLRGRKGYKIVDRGRGLFPFFLISMISLSAPILLFFFNELPFGLKNMQLVFRILADCGKILWSFSCIGSIVCFIRKILNLTFNSNCSTIIITRKNGRARKRSRIKR